MGVKNSGRSLLCLLAFISVAHGFIPTSNVLREADTSYTNISRQWSSWWGPGFKFMEAAVSESLDDILTSCNTSSPVIAILNGAKPMRRDISLSEPFLQILDEQNSAFVSMNASHKSEALGQQNTGQQLLLSDVLSLSALNKGMQVVEKVLGRPMYSFRIQFVPFNVTQAGCKPPLAVWSVSSGVILIDQKLRISMEGYVEQISRISGHFASSLTSRMADFIPTTASDSQGTLWGRLATTVVPGALLVAFGSQIPLWFCIACPVVLGLLAPFIINAGFGEAAEAICSHYNLPVDECNDLWYGAFAAAMILSLASAIPIVYICQIPKCARMSAS